MLLFVYEPYPFGVMQESEASSGVALKDATAVVVVLHRQGDTGLGAQVEFANLHTYAGQFEAVLRQRGVLVLYPNYHTAWYGDDEDAIATACADVTRRIMQLVSGRIAIQSERIFVGGFGKGATLSLRLAITLPLRLGGYFVLDGWRSSTALSEAASRMVVNGVPPPNVVLCLSAGRDDAQLRSALTESGAIVDLYRVRDDEISRQVEIVADWLMARLPASDKCQDNQGPRKNSAKSTVSTTKTVSWYLERAPDSTSTVAVFQVPVGCEDLFGRFPVICCGATFDIKPKGNGEVETTFYSPT